MITIQISSDPYKRKITYDRVDGDQLVAIDSSNPDTPEKLKLLSVDYSSCFIRSKRMILLILFGILTPLTPHLFVYGSEVQQRNIGSFVQFAIF